MVIKINGSDILVVAHRGGRYWKGKGKNFNYISEALYHGADIIELDIKKKGKDYIVKHTKASITQGLLKDALTKVGKAPIYLDIKDQDIDPNDLIKFVRSKLKNILIIGSFYSSILKKVKKSKNVLLSYHVYSPLYDIKLLKRLKIDWVVLWNYNVAHWKIKNLNELGIMVAPAGNVFLGKQIKYLNSGANIVFVYDVKKFKKSLYKSLISQTKIKDKNFIYSALNQIEYWARALFPEERTINSQMNAKHLSLNKTTLSTLKINFKLK